MNLENNNIVKTITNVFSDDTSPLSELSSFSTPGTSTITPSNVSGTNNLMGFISNITWQTWIIVILALALIGINVFAYLAKGTQTLSTIFEEIFGPILKLFGYTALETTKQTITTSATGTTAGVNAVANTSVSAINTVEQAAQNGTPIATSGTSMGLSTTNVTNNTIPQGQMAISSQQATSIHNQKVGAIQQYKEDSLEKALSSAAQTGGEVQPYDLNGTTKSTGKAGWCYIGEDLGVRSCSQVGVNDVCMSGDVFPTQEICMNPNLRA